MTENEITMIESILDSEYINPGNDPVEYEVWFENPFPTKRTASGVMSSLVKKGYVIEYYSGTPDHQVQVTKTGAEAYKQAVPSERSEKFLSWDDQE